MKRSHSTALSPACCIAAFILLLPASAHGRSQPVGQAVHVVEFEQLAGSANVSGGAAIVQPMGSFGSGWGGDAQLFWRPPGPNSSMALQFDAPEPGEYELTLFYTVAPDFGDFSVRVRGAASAQVRGYEPSVALRSVFLGRHTLDASSNQLVFDVSGKSSASSGYILGLDRLELSRVDGGGVATNTPAPATRVAIPGLRPALRAAASSRVRDEFVVVQDGKLRLGYVADGQIVLTDEQTVPGFLYYAGDFDGTPGDELLAYDPAAGSYFLLRFDAQGQVSAPELLRQVPFSADTFRTTGRFADATATCLLGWREGEGFGLARLLEGACFRADAFVPVSGVAIPVDVTGDGREEAIFIDTLGTIDVAVLGGPIPAPNPADAPRLEVSMQRAAEGWDPGLELAHADLDGNGAAELLAVVRSAGEVWRLTFDSAGRVTDRRVVGAPWPATWSLLQSYDADGDGADELLVRDSASAQFLQARWNAEVARLETSELEGVAASFVYRGRFLGNGRDSLLLQQVWPDRGSKVGLVGLTSTGAIEWQIDDDRFAGPERATIVVGDFIAGG